MGSTTLQAAAALVTPPTRSPRLDQRLRKGTEASVKYFIPGIVEKRRGSAIYSVGLVQLSGLYTNAKSRYKYPQPPSSPGNLDFFFFFFLSFLSSSFPYLHASLGKIYTDMFNVNNHNFTTHLQMKSTGKGGETRVPFMITLETLMLALAITATILRTRLRRRSMGRLRVEDWCCIGATVRTSPRLPGWNQKGQLFFNYLWK